MKSGASDPFADVGPDDGDEDAADADGESDQAADDTESGGRSATDSSAIDRGSPGRTSPSTTRSSASAGTRGAGDLRRDELPLVLRRERVKDERPEVHQLFVQQTTHDRAVEAERTLQDRLEDDLARTDARDAIYRAGMEHLDDAEDLLREWGYDL